MISYDGLYALSREIDDGLRKMKAVGHQVANARMDYPVPGGWGTVTVTGAGHVVSISLDPSRLRYANGQALGAALTEAINGAERRAAAQLRERVNEVRPRIQ